MQGVFQHGTPEHPVVHLNCRPKLSASNTYSLLPWISISRELIKDDFRFNNTANYLLKVTRSVQLSVFIKLYSPTSSFIGVIKYCIDYVMLKLCHKMTFKEGKFL